MARQVYIPGHFCSIGLVIHEEGEDEYLVQDGLEYLVLENTVETFEQNSYRHITLRYPVF